MSPRLRWYLVSAAALAALLSLVGPFTRSPAPLQGPRGSTGPRLAATVPAVSPGGEDLGTTTSRREAPPITTVHYRVRDLVTGRPVRATLLDAAGDPLATTDAAGEASVDGDRRPSSLLVAPDGQGVATDDDECLHLPVELAEAPDDDGVRIVTVAVFARVVLDVVDPTRQERALVALSDRDVEADAADGPTDAASTARVRVVPLPPLPTDARVPVDVRLELATNRALYPEMYLEQLEGLGAATVPRPVDVDLPAGGGAIDVPFAGEACVITSIDRRVPHVATISLVRGDVSRTRAVVTPKPVLAGVLLDAERRPVPGQKVTFACSSVFAPPEVIPHSMHEPGGPALVTLGSKGAAHREVVAVHSCVSDRDGRFELAMPYTDAVLASSFVSGLGVAVRRIGLGSRAASMTDIELVLLPPGPDDGWMTIVDAQGRPCADLSCQPAELERPELMMLQYPRLRTDADGRLDVSLLEPGRRYALFSERGLLQFVCADRGTIVLGALDGV